MDKPRVGQILYSLNVGSEARNAEQKLTPVEVVKVGRKYFSTRVISDSNYARERKYHIETWGEKTDFCVNSILYEDQQGYYDEKENREICGLINDYFGHGRNNRGIALDVLRKIKSILEE